MNTQIKKIEGGIVACKGFKASGIASGIKKKPSDDPKVNPQKDLALIFSEKPANFAATFTTNVVKAAPVQWSQLILNENPTIQAIVANSGNANACTGLVGMEHTELMAKKVSECLKINPKEVIVCSTGVIGVLLPIEIILNGIQTITPKLGESIKDGDMAAQAIMTTDLVDKQVAVEFSLGDKTIHIGGMCKGSGMIHPNMATMLGFITTDINISQPLLLSALQESVYSSFNMISVDGDTSTNDQVTLMANGAAENPYIENEDDMGYTQFKEVLEYVCQKLAKKIAIDGEGASKLITAHIKGAASLEDARTISKSVISSNLTKAAFYGEDANWGRILCAMGYSGVQFNPNKVNISFTNKVGSINLMVEGTPQQFDEDFALKILKEKKVTIEMEIMEGNAEATAWGCDLTHKYVDINAHYRT